MIYRKVLVLLTLLLCVGWSLQEEVAEDQYYDDYYEEEEGATAQVGVSGATMDDGPVIGFRKSVGGGVAKIVKFLVDEEYLNMTAEVYDCVKRVDSGILALEPNTTEDEEPDITQQVNDLRKKMEAVVNVAAALANGTDASQNATATNDTASGIVEEIPSTQQSRVKRLSFREKQELRMKERREQEAARELLRPKFRLGADCETLLCGACKAIVEEFGVAVHAAAKNPKIKYVEEVAVGLCARKEVKMKYVDMVSDICVRMEQENSGYKEALLQPFEADDHWDQLLTAPSMNAKKLKVCTDVGACDAEQFEFVHEPLDYLQEHWDDKCYVCQAFAKDLEERVQLTRHVTEGNIVPIVAGTCDRLTLAPHYREVCLQLTQGKLLDDISWLGKVHSESVARKAKAEQAFPDKLCEEIDWCKAYVDPEKLREKQAQETMEAVFF